MFELTDFIDDYLQWCEETGAKTDKPFSVKFDLRIDPELHRNLSIELEIHHESRNT